MIWLNTHLRSEDFVRIVFRDVFDVSPNGLRQLVELAPGVSVEEVHEKTKAAVTVVSQRSEPLILSLLLQSDCLRVPKVQLIPMSGQ